MSGIYDEQILGAEQQARTAQKLREGMTTPQGQMVSGWYVPPSITQYMAEALKGYFAGKQGSEAKNTYDTLTKKKQEETARFAEMLAPKTAATPTPEQTSNMGQPVDLSKSQPIPAVDTTTTQPTEQEMMAGLLGLAKVNPEAAGPALAINQWQTGRQDKSEAMAQAQQDRLELERQRALDRAAMMTGGDTKQYFQPIQTADGIYAFNSRTGKMELVSSVKGAQNDPALQGKIAEAKGAGKTIGTAQGTAQTSLDQTLSQGDTTLKQLDDLLKHPGFSTAVGVGNEITRFAPSGTETRNFLTRLDQLKGGQFLQAYQTLKGGGQITEVEGKKATEAIARMNATSSEVEFKQAVNDFADVIRAGMERAKQQSQGNFAPVTSAPTAAGGAKFLGFE